MIKSKLRLSLSILALAAVMTFGTGSALAQESSLGTYAGGGGGNTNQVDSGAPGADTAAATADPTGALPFSGLDIGLALGGGLLLLATGMAISRLVVRGEEA
jgi:hypothetical protein